MNFFDDDPFDEIVREFFGHREGKPRRRYDYRRVIEGEDDERSIDFIESGKKVFIVFEIPGYSKEDISINVGKREMEITAKKTNFENTQNYLIPKLKHGVKIKKIIPSSANAKKFSYTFKNGILEVVFEKK